MLERKPEISCGNSFVISSSWAQNFQNQNHAHAEETSPIPSLERLLYRVREVER